MCEEKVKKWKVIRKVVKGKLKGVERKKDEFIVEVVEVVEVVEDICIESIFVVIIELVVKFGRLFVCIWCLEVW